MQTPVFRPERMSPISVPHLTNRSLTAPRFLQLKAEPRPQIYHGLDSEVFVGAAEFHCVCSNKLFSREAAKQN